MSQLHPLLQPYVPSPDDPFDAVKAAHLLNRAGFGGTPEEIERVVEMGPRQAVEHLLDFPDAPADEQSADDVPDLSSIEGYPKTFSDRRKMFLGKTPEERQALLQQLMAANREAIGLTIAWWLKRMARGRHPLQEKLTLFWHGHFTTSARDERSAWLMWQQHETLRANAAGNFREFVRQISRDPAMIDYLNNQQNRKQKPNENYARELMELFTLGLGNYTEQDIKEAARAFTGWAHDGDDFVYRKFDHDDGPKTFFGKRGNFDGDDVIDIILQHHASSAYVAQRLLGFFVTESPDLESCQKLGDLIRDAKWDLRPALYTMFTSRAFYDTQTIGSQIKSPVQLVVGTARLLDVELPEPRQLYGALDQMGQVPLMPPNVKGWPGGRAWINTNTLFVRYNTCVWLAGGGKGIGGGNGGFFRNDEDRKRGGGGAKFKPRAEDSAEATVDYWTQRLIQRPIPDQRKAVLVEALDGKPNSAEAVKRMVQLIVSMPEYQLC